MTIDFGDGVSALDRLMRSIVMMTDGAINTLMDMGYSRDDITINVHGDGLPLWIDLKGQRVFLIESSTENDIVVVKGNWIKKVKPVRSYSFFSFFTRLFRS
jgi:hypothetical protein